MTATESTVGAFCLIVPSGTWQMTALIDALHDHHPEAEVHAVWCGDPHLRPVLDDAHHRASWCDLDLAEPAGWGWGRLIVGLHPRAYEWCRAAAAVARLLDEGTDSVAVLRVGSVAVLGDCSALMAGPSVTLVPRCNGTLPVDGLAPTEADLVMSGRHSIVAAGFRAAAKPALEWFAQQLLGAGDTVGPWLDRVGELFGAVDCSDPAIGVGGWRSHLDPVLLDLDDLDHAEQWHFTFASAPARIRLSAETALADAVAHGRHQIVGRSAVLALPGRVVVDAAIRRLVANELTSSTPSRSTLPVPFGEHHSAFLRWLEQPSPVWGATFGRYWRQLRAERADLQVAFPRPDGRDQADFIAWSSTSWLDDDRSSLIGIVSTDAIVDIEGTKSPPVEAVKSVASVASIASVGHDPSGVNVVGYHSHDLSLGLIARQITAALESVDVPVAAIDHHRTGSPVTEHLPLTTREVAFATNIIVVNADQFEFLVSDMGVEVLDGRTNIAYWFWELDEVPAQMVAAIDDVDEVWAGSQFVADAFARVTDKPVRCVPIPVSEPEVSGRDRASLGIPTDRFVFLVTFDHFSVTERKNPFGAIEAFRRAFSDGDGPLLLIKTVNGDVRWQSHERLLLATRGRSDIVVWDEHLSRPDQMAVHKASDCLVSLHRSEGLGLHCAEAMWLGKLVIASRYSGNLDFMDDDCSLLVDCTMTAITDGEGVYPPTGRWADPDLDQAAAFMRQVAADPTAAAAVGARARRRMTEQPSQAATGRRIAALVGIAADTTSTRDRQQSDRQQSDRQQSDIQQRSTAGNPKQRT